MAFKLKITKVEKVRHQANRTNFLDIAFDITKAGEVVASRKIAMEPGTSLETVEGELKRYLDAYVLEQEQADARKDEDEIERNVTNLQKKLVGKEVV